MRKFFSKLFLYGFTLLMVSVLLAVIFLTGYGILDTVCAESTVFSANISDIEMAEKESIFTRVRVVLRLAEQNEIIEIVTDRSIVENLTGGQVVKIRQHTNYFTRARRYEIIPEVAGK